MPTIEGKIYDLNKGEKEEKALIQKIEPEKEMEVPQAELEALEKKLGEIKLQEKIMAYQEYLESLDNQIADRERHLRQHAENLVFFLKKVKKVSLVGFLFSGAALGASYLLLK